MSKNNWSRSVVIVTGAASGMGRELVLQIHGLGAFVIAADWDLKGLTETVKMLPDTGQRISSYQLDISNHEEIIQFADTIIPKLNDRTLILINNAGVALNSGNFNDTTLTDMEWVFNINYWGAVRLTKAFYPYFIFQKKGHIVNVSSVFGLAGVAYQTAYCSSKFAIRGFTETLRMELLGTDIQTTSVHPGGIKTNITKNAKRSDLMQPAHEQVTDRFGKMAKTTPQQAAKKIISAISKKKKKLLIGNDAVLLDFVVRLFPVFYTVILKPMMERMFHDPYKLLNKKQ